MSLQAVSRKRSSVAAILSYRIVGSFQCLCLVAGGKWTDEAMDRFDTLAHCAKWKPLLAKIASFPSPGASHFQIQLFDPSRDPMLDIGQELIRLGLAVEHRTSPVKSDDDESLVSRLLAEVTSMSEKPEPTSFVKLQEEHRLESGKRHSAPGLSSPSLSA
ncbi:unnamed protein product [Staurois parvus]|uniref:Uncharacterized protein n=1 Tax=Staurois parvus TaxID=386267 RepID=A0ABN9CYI5_9NEOB|nr:unnamed protein product [Staurois parvus]